MNTTDHPASCDVSDFVDEMRDCGECLWTDDVNTRTVHPCDDHAEIFGLLLTGLSGRLARLVAHMASGHGDKHYSIDSVPL